MQDMIPKGTGNSRFLKSVENFMTLYPSYESFVAALVAGTLPVDFNGVNPDGIAQSGTPLNKNTLLSDATAALLGLDPTAVPDDAFVAVGPFTLASHTWARYSGGNPVLTETAMTNVSFTKSGTAGFRNMGWAYSDAVSLKVLPSGEVQVTLDEPVYGKEVYNEASSSYMDTYTSLFRGKYCTCGEWPGYVLYIPTDATFDYTTSATTYVTGDAHGSGAWRTKVDKAVLITPSIQSLTFEKYVQSFDSSAYPTEGYRDGYWYSYRANMRDVIDHPTHFVYGSYVGTGLSGESGTVTLTFDFAPQVLMIFNSNGTMFPGNMMVYDTTYCDVPAIGFPQALTTEFKAGLFRSEYSPGSLLAKRSADGKTISWYHTYGYYNSEEDYTFYTYGHLALNDAKTYYYVAIG